MWTCGRTARRLQRGHALARECAAATKKQVRFYVISAHDELPPCLQGRKVTQPHGDGGGKLWVLFACRKNVAMVFRKGSGVTPMAMAVDACAKVATKNRGERSSSRSSAQYATGNFPQGSGVTPMAMAVESYGYFLRRGYVYCHAKNKLYMHLRSIHYEQVL